MAKKPRTPEQQERDTDLRLRRTYGITLDEYNERLAKQGGGCAICGNPAVSKRLHVDHSHRFVKAFNIVRTKIGSRVKGFLHHAHTIDFSNPGRRFYLEVNDAETRVKATSILRHLLKRNSVRGILCWNCNRGLRIFSDSPRSLERAAQYLRDFAAQTA